VVPRTRATLDVTRLGGTLRGRALSGRANLRITPPGALAGALDIRSGQSRVDVVGADDRELNGRVRLAIASLADWVPGAAGSLRGQFAFRGQWPDITIDGSLDGSALRWQQQSLESIRVDVDIARPLTPSGRARVTLADLRSGDLNWDRGQLSFEGDMAAHRVQASVDGEQLNASIRAAGGYQRATWNGSLEMLTLDARGIAAYALERPVSLMLGANRASLEQACFVDRRSRICLGGEYAPDGALRARYALTDVPLTLSRHLLPREQPYRVQGRLGGEGDVSRTSAGEWSGTLALQVPRGRVVQRIDVPGDRTVREELLAFADVALNARLEGRDARAQLSAQLAQTGRLDATVTVAGLGAGVSPLGGRIALELPTLAPIEPFVPQFANVAGRASLDAQLGGTLDAPRVSGSLVARDLAAGLPELGLKLRDGTLRATLEDSARPRARVDARVTSGDGTVEVSGEVGLDGTARARIGGQDVLLVDLPSARLIANPQLVFERSLDRMTLDGEVDVVRARVDLQRLPRTTVQGASSDVVVIDDPVRAEAPPGLPLFANVRVRTLRPVDLTGFGLDATVAGEVRVREEPDAMTTGSGELALAGRYKAYGQDLTIREGRLLYAATPLDNPSVSLVAVRVIDDVTAGLRVTGRAQSPVLTVFSEPAMGEANALSYLVAGKPLESIGQGNGEDGDLLQQAAQSLGTAAGGLLAKNLGKRLGVDELSVEDDAEIGGAALTLGYYLSPRLYVRYGFGLFEPGQVLTLRYRVSSSVAIEAATTPTSSRATVEYRIER
jgi:translocation and assembly module TamB